MQPLGSPEFVLAGFEHKLSRFRLSADSIGVTTTVWLGLVGPELADWMWNGSWLPNLLGVATVSGGTELIDLLKYHLAGLTTTNCQIMLFQLSISRC